MADIELVIKMPEWQYKTIKENKMGISTGITINALGAIQQGIPLPKGHGRIADMDAAIKCIEEVEGEDAVWAISLIEWACSKRRIIEADKEQNE